MQSVTVDKAELIKKVQENRAAHQQASQDAEAGWLTKVGQALRSAVETLDAAADVGDLNFGYKFPRPQDHSDEYDRVLQMLTWAAGDVIELSEIDFRHFVQDDWEWSHQFRASSQAYAS